VRDHVGERVALFVQFLETGQALLEGKRFAAQLQMGADSGVDLLELEGLADVVDAAGLEGTDFVGGVGECADEEHRDVAPARVGLEAAADFVASMSGMLMSSRTRSGGMASTTLRAISPLETGRTL
jgi:hypothetical protein